MKMWSSPCFISKGTKGELRDENSIPSKYKNHVRSLIVKNNETRNKLSLKQTL